MKTEIYRNTRPLIGRIEYATYREPANRLYRHNCFIEALPARWSLDEVAKRIVREPGYDEGERSKTALERLDAVNTLSRCVFLMPDMIEIEQMFSGMLRSGYCERNPLTAQWAAQIRSGFPDIYFGDGVPLIRSNAAGFAIVGISGVGKSLMVDSILGLYPQVIIHEYYEDTIFLQKQLVWLKLECPRDATLSGLCISFFDAIDTILGTNVSKDYGIDKNQIPNIAKMVRGMAQLAAALGLGVLVIDEIQRLVCRKENDPKGLLKFFEELTNIFSVPVLLMGTPKAFNLFSQNFASGRRLAAPGDFLIANFAKDKLWERFITKLWKYQYTSTPTKLTPSLNKALYEESQGIADIVVKLYMLAQIHVIGKPDETITVRLIKDVADKCLNSVKPILTALRTHDYEALKEVDDIRFNPEILQEHLWSKTKSVILSGTINTIENQQKAANASTEGMTESPEGRIVSLLIGAGFSKEVAITSAQQAVVRFAAEFDLKKASSEAFRIAAEAAQPVQVTTSSESSPVPTPPKPKKSNVVSLSGDLRLIYQTAKKNKQPMYDALKNANYIKPLTDFMEAVNG